MMRTAAAAFLLAVAVAVAAREAPEPEGCLAGARGSSAVEVSHSGKTYRLASEACRAQFLSDPERYSQLYDALMELEAEGTPLRATPPSLVPS